MATDEREWIVEAENYVWHARAVHGRVETVKNSEPVAVVPKARAMAAEQRVRELRARRVLEPRAASESNGSAA